MSGGKVELTRPKGEDWNDMFKGVSIKEVRRSRISIGRGRGHQQLRYPPPGPRNRTSIC